MKHIVYINKLPVRCGTFYSTPDGAINGNGDLGIILGVFDEGLRIYISKNDIWYACEHHDLGGLRPLGYIDVYFGDKSCGGKFHAEQDMDNGEIRATYGDICLTVRVAKTENAIMLETSSKAELKPFGGDVTGISDYYSYGDISGVCRIFNDENTSYPTECYGALTALEGKYYAFVATNHDVKDPKRKVADKIRKINSAKYDKLLCQHYAEWKKFYAKSAFEIADDELELCWYSSQYFTACACGNKKFAPGLYANFITTERPSWKSDYHLNYNYQAPFYGVCSSNHPELLDCYHGPLFDFMDKGREFAEKFGCRGIMYPVGIGPGGIVTEYQPTATMPFERLFLGQKSNAIHGADIMIFRWRATRDLDYAREVAYPFLKEAILFFEDYAVIEDGKLTIHRDAAHEVPYYREDFREDGYKEGVNDVNPVLTLGMLRLALENAIDMAVSLGVDEDKIIDWKNMLDIYPEYPTTIRRGQRVFRYTKKGQRWNDDNDVGLQHIYPAGQIGLSSDKALLKIALNSFWQKSYCFEDENACCSYYPMAARLGVNPSLILKKFRKLNQKKLMPNMIYEFAGGGFENCSIAATMLNEMALQSYEGIIRIFPDWDKSINASYRNLRADGAVLVSAYIRDGEIGNVRLMSEKGGKIRVANPYNTCVIELPDGTHTSNKPVFQLDTKPGDIIILKRG